MSPPTDDEARRRYWAQVMDEAYDFMTRALDHPVAECREPVTSLIDAVGTEGVVVEFSTRPHAAAAPRLYYLRESLIPRFLAAARELNEAGWVMRVEDALRTPAMQKALAGSDEVFDRVLRRVVWECCGQQPPPELVLRRLTALAATTPKTGTHIAGSALDISVLSADGEEVDRDGRYVEISELTPMDSPYIRGGARTHREKITAMLGKHGFVAYPYEFWHYSQGDVYEALVRDHRAPARYGPVDVSLSDGAVNPLDGAEVPLFSTEEVGVLIERALVRLESSISAAVQPPG